MTSNMIKIDVSAIDPQIQTLAQARKLFDANIPDDYDSSDDEENPMTTMLENTDAAIVKILNAWWNSGGRNYVFGEIMKETKDT